MTGLTLNRLITKLKYNKSKLREIWPKATEWPRPMSYYSKHGVCLPKLFTTTADLNWSYPFFIMMFDFATFLYIMGSYILTYKVCCVRISSKLFNVMIIGNFVFQLQEKQNKRKD